jgi:type II secretory pathway component PulC
LAEGPQAFISQVDVRPAFQRGRFFGWRIVDYRGPGHLRRGDIVVQVNGLGLERPEQFVAAWAGLRRARALEFELIREGRRQTFRYPILE